MIDINTVGIIGAGTMGSALAQKFAQEGMNVVMVDREDRFVEKGMENIRSTLEEGIARKIFSENQLHKIPERIIATTNLEDIGRCQLVIEAVFEDLAVKEDLFRQISSIVPPDTILATNTSSFSVTGLSASVRNPERFLGLHFFYHAAKNRLVEVIKGKSTSEEVFGEALWFMLRCGKDPIVCRDSHGFVVNRFFVPWLNEAVRIYEEGVAEPAAIDAAARAAFRCGMGPFALMNATGVPIAYHAQKTLEEAFGKFYQPAEALFQHAERNESWDIYGNEDIDPALSEAIVNRMLAVIFFVCGQLLDEKVCTAGDIHRGAAIGLRWRKGPVELFHWYGESQVRTFVAAVADAWDQAMPESLSTDDWQPDYIIVERKATTGIITINRPEALNAINPTVICQLTEAFDELNRDSSIETIVVIGRGKAFVAGADIRFFIDRIRNNELFKIVEFTRAGQELFQCIDDSPKKVVAIVNGLALGGGLELALAADTILALDKARMAFPETGIGIYPGLGGTQRTVQRVGIGLTKYLIYTGEVISANQASEIGLVDRVIAWDEMRDVLQGSISFEMTTPLLTEKWRQTGRFFDRHSVAQLLDEDQPRNSEISSDRWAPIVKRIRSKAPIALRRAEKLINEQRGPASELEYVEEIFSTEDALTGLLSVGGKAPVFEGR